MGILIDPTPAEPDRGGTVKPALETVGHLLALSFGDAAGSGYEAIKAFRAKNETLEQRVWTLWRETLALALPEFFVTAMLTRRPDDEELTLLLADILEDSERLAKAGQAAFNDVDRRTPTDFPLYLPLRAKLPAWAHKVAPEHLRDDERLRERLDRAFERGFRRAIADRGDHFAPILDFFEGDEAEVGNRRDAWRRYYEGLSKEIEENPLFNQPEDGSGATLGAIFQPLRCYWQERVKRSRRDQVEDHARPDTIHINWLQAELEDWLAKRRSSDALRVVTGGPGSGKSSSALWFARDTAYAGSINVFVIRLQGLDVNRSIEAIVKDIVDFGSDHSMLEESPLSWLRDDPKPLLLIFDGLDEVARPDGAGLEVTKTFLRTLHGHLGNTNRELKAKLMALALGRPQAAEEAALAIGGSLDDRALLHVAPLSPLASEFLKRSGHSLEPEIKDPEKLIGDDFRGTFYERYRPFDTYSNGKGTPEALRDDGLAEMTVEPLLLYLLIISGYAGKDWELAKDNRNRVYERIFQGIHERDLKKPVGHPSKMGIEDEEDFFALMECLGLAAWLGGGRSGSDEDFALVRDEVYLPEREDDFRDLPSAKLDNVALQTFTHRDDREKPGYAFIHKSFGEYLTARALVGAGERWCGDRTPRRINLFTEDWLQLTAGARLTYEILDFMIDEAKLRTANLREARNRVTALSTIARHTLRHGFPAHSELATYKGTADWRRRELFQRNAEEALFSLMHSWAEAAYPYELLNRDASNDGWAPGPIGIFDDGPGIALLDGRLAVADSLLRRIGNQWSEHGIGFDVLARLDLSRQFLRLTDFQIWRRSPDQLGGVNLLGANLGGANLGGAYLSEANLGGANLGGADLGGANLGGAYLRGANLDGANLGRAYLRDANLGGANLDGANLDGADLDGAYLGRADLGGANLVGANLGGADLGGADLRGVDLGGAYLDGADCSRLRIDSARLQSADLSEAVNLTQDQIDRAYGNSETKLPDGMTIPKERLRDD